MSRIDYWLLENYKLLGAEKLRQRFELNLHRGYVPVAMYLCPRCSERQILDDDLKCPACDFKASEIKASRIITL